MRKAEEKSYRVVFIATKIPKWSQTLLRNGISQATKYVDIEMMNV
jgi:predicted transcriptional regulator